MADVGVCALANRDFKRGTGDRDAWLHPYFKVKGRAQEADELKRPPPPEKKARRGVVEVAHSCFNRFRKLLVRHEKRNRGFLALNHLAALIIALERSN